MGDVAEITALVYAYAERLDAGDLDGVANLFAHATWRAPRTGAHLRGFDEVRAVYDRVRLYDGVPRTRHVITNLVVDDPAGGDTATARCTFTVLQGVTRGRPLQVIVSGRYTDRFERVDGAWRFADRLFSADLLGDQREHFA